eukprot:TRINITY_DN11217_c0_g1_i2.p1 TRINITY_DN11217_c0_g1~~TRINITY_DN11217_c0_g1_i2.p1  ORF type:complete len:943 (+),score=219.81 TRINITY_DN11217_c0_g1_i2:371-3199(+)
MASANLFRCHDSTDVCKAPMFAPAAPTGAVPRRPSVAELAVQPVPKELHCSICSQVFDDPKVAVPCGHTFCGKCINQVLKAEAACPTCNKSLTSSLLCPCLSIKQLTESLRIRCVNGVSFDMASGKFTPTGRDGACQMLIPLSEQQNHEKQCPHAPVCCKYEADGCTKVKPRIFIEEHEAQCAFRSEICKCGAQVRGSQMAGHLVLCAAVQLECPYKRFGCEEVCERASMLEHINCCRFGAVLHILEKQEEDRKTLLATIATLQEENSELHSRNASLEVHFQEADQRRSREDELNMELIRLRKMVAESNAKLVSSQDCVRQQNMELNALHTRMAELEEWWSEITASRGNSDQLQDGHGRGEKPTLELLQLCPPPGLESSGPGPDTERWAEDNRAGATDKSTGRAGKMQVASSEYPFRGSQCPFSEDDRPRVERLKSLTSVDCSPFVHLDEIKDGEVLSGSHSPTEVVHQSSVLKHGALAWGLSGEVPGCHAECRKEGNDEKHEVEDGTEAELLEGLMLKSAAKIEHVDKVVLDSSAGGTMGDSMNWNTFRARSASPVQDEKMAPMAMNGTDEGGFHARKNAFLERLSKIEVKNGGEDLDLGLMALCGALETVEEGHGALTQEQKNMHLRERKPKMFSGGSSRQCSSEKDVDDDGYGEGDAMQSRRLSKRKIEQILNEERCGKRRSGYGVDNKGTDTPGQSGGSPVSAGKRPDYRGGKKNPIYACTEELRDEERCIRGDGKTWRCGKRRVHDRFCESHFLQQKLKSEGGGLVTFKKSRKHTADGGSGLKRKSDGTLRKKGTSVKGMEGMPHQGLPKAVADGTQGQMAQSSEDAGLTKGETNMASQVPGTPMFHVYRGGKKNPLYAGKEYLKDEERCIRGDGRDWRCGRRRMGGEKFCETHFNQQKLKAERKHAKRGSSSDGGRKASSKGSEDEDISRVWNDPL